ncbi:MAG: type IV pilus modification protein PilV [Magnetococcus sp. DMHC-6]
MNPSPKRQSGFTLIEVLISLVVMSTGLLAVGLMQAKGIVSAGDAFQRTQATWLAYEMLDRMRANPNNLTGYLDKKVGYNQIPVTDPGTVTMASQRTTKDLYEWQNNLSAVAGRTGLYQAIGSISKIAGLYKVQIQWQGGSKQSGVETRKVWVETDI